MRDASSGQRLVNYGTIILAVLAVIGYAVNAAQEQAAISDKLDRNCRILVTLDQDIRFVALQQADPSIARKSFAPFPQASC